MSDENKDDPWLGEKPDSYTSGSDDAKVNTSEAGDNKKDEIKWERHVIEKLVMGLFSEQRRSRRWNIIFKGLFLAYFLMLFFIYMPDMGDTSVSIGKHTALIEIQGVIAADSEASADNVITGLRAAFNDKGTAGIILRINSPGGSPVQAGYINDEIERLRGKHPDIPVYTVITDICASGGYYIAVAADQIYADKASIVGSIGVLMDGFGFVDAMKKIGVERRLLTAGEHKGFLDPFSPVNAMEKQHVENLLSEIHQQFISVVKKGRGDRLKPNEALFSGLVWSGEQGVEMGLVDGLGSSSYVAREVIGVERISDFTHKVPALDRFIERIGIAMANTLTAMTIK